MTMERLQIYLWTSKYFFQSGILRFKKSKVFLKTGSPKKPNPAEKPQALIII